MSRSDKPSIEIDVSAVVPDCPRCGGEGLLAAHVPYGWERADGQWIDGLTLVVLCPACDADDAAGGALITFFHVHGRVDLDTVTECADLLHQWVTGIKLPELDDTALDAEVEAWYRGEL